MQTTALLIDSLRLVISRKLFWITLALSGLVALFYGSIGFNDEGVFLGFGLWSWENSLFTKDSPFAAQFYISLFSDVILKYWLGWIAIILAIISTATIFPDFLASGSVDLILSKPITRTKVFLVKYLGSLLFVLLQVAILCLGIFLCIGLRAGEWNIRLFLAVPLIVAVFSYLYAVNVLLVMVTRSMLAALLLTFLFWAVLWGGQSTPVTLAAIKHQMTVQAEMSDADVERFELQLSALENPDTPDDQEADTDTDTDTETETDTESERAELQKKIEVAREGAAGGHRIAESIAKWQDAIDKALLVLPKTQDTKHLMNRWLLADQGAALAEAQVAEARDYDPENFKERQEYQGAEMGRRIQAEFAERSPWYILTTSFAFEAVLVLLAWIIFIRRDY